MREMSIPPPTFRIRRASAAITALLACTSLVHAAPLVVTASKHDGKALAGAIVTVEAVSPALPPAPPEHATMDQVNLTFVPDVLVVPVHSTVQFPNSDAIGHQVYSFSSARRFQLPLYRGKPYPPVAFDEAGIVTLGCNIHDNMLAYIVVTRAPWFGRTDASGKWVVPDLPAGRFRLRLWHPLLNEPLEIERLIDAGADEQRVEIRLSRALRPAPLTGRPHSWDY
jgi:plastocyanin